MKNAVYSETIENFRNRVNVSLVSNEKDYLKWTSKPNFVAQRLSDNELVAIHKIKTTLTFSKPTYVECVLELRKARVYEFHYDYIKNKYRSKLRLLFPDTDSLVFEIETENVYENFSKNKEMFEFSNYFAKSKYYDDSNKLVVLKIKDEMGGVATEEFVGLKPKVYSNVVSDSNEKKKEKGINKNVFAKIISIMFIAFNK